MSVINITPVILCGGAGSRLWPMSRDEKPKQFHALFNDKSLLANTIARTRAGLVQDVSFQSPIILGSASLRQAFEAEMSTFDTSPSAVMLEPSVRDTAAAIAAVTALTCETNPDKLLLVLPSDARIDDHEEFRQTIARAAKTAQASDAIMTIGIAPTRPETQYGYIEQGEPLGEGHAVRKFHEKPDAETAQNYLAQGSFLWNAGMFIFRAGRLADDFLALQPEIWEQASAAVKNAKRDGLFVYLDEAAFNAAPKLSMDFAIMEKASNIGVIPAQFEWDDLGSWAQLYQGAEKDTDGNASAGDTILVDARNNYIRSDGPLVAAAGVEGLTIVAEENKILVATTKNAHLTKDVCAEYKKSFAANTRQSGQAIKAWLFDDALPFWATKGMDFDHGGAHEALAFDGSPAPHPQKRLRVTARQIYCFAHASIMGWQGDSDTVLQHCFDTLIQTGWHEDGGFIHLYNPDGSVLDNTRDTYDQCFVLLAMAWLWRAKKWDAARHWADKTLSYLDQSLSDSVNGGYYDNNKNTLPRRANPHMHFLEAMLAWYDATAEKEYLDRAGQIVNLFEQHYYDPATGTLTERFNDDWSPIVDPDADHLVEPGHHYEWAWLLMRFDELRPTDGLAAKARTLYATARAFGHHEKTGAVADTMSVDGSFVSGRARCWPQTEALKAAIAMENDGLASATALQTKMLDVLQTHYIDGPIKGGWYDAINDNGYVAAPDMPSSTFYHLYCALAEYIEK